MNKKDFTHGALYVHTKDNNKIDYTLRYIVFDPTKFFVSTDVAKEVFRKKMHISKKLMAEQYDSIFASWIKIGRGKNCHVEFNKVPKTAANIIFIVPKAWKKHAFGVIKGLELPYEKTIFKTLIDHYEIRK